MKQKHKTNTGIKYPSARLKGLKDLVIFIQEPTWKPSKIDAALLKKLDIGRGREHETAYAIFFLGLIDSSGKPTNIFDELKKNYMGTMERLIRDKYADLFSILPPSMINQSRLVKFFESPVETSEYQAKLFVWFCEQAGIDLPNIEERFHRARFDKPKLEKGEKE